MTDKVTLTDLANLQNENTAVTAVNANNAAITTAVNNTLSRDGTSPNQMGALLDMNSNRILNLPEPLQQTEPLRLLDLAAFNSGGSFDIQQLPAGGTVGQLLTKTDSTDFNSSWENSTLVALDSYGAVGDGTTDNATIFATALADAVTSNKGALLVGGKNYKVSDFNEFDDKRVWGFGQIIDDGGNKRAPWHVGISTPPTRDGSYDPTFIGTVFNSDFSHVHIAAETWLDTNALGSSPGTNTYVVKPETDMIFLANENFAGFHDIANGDRSGISLVETQLAQVGGGDLVAFHSTGIVTSTNAGSTSFLQNPAIVFCNCDYFTFVDGAFLNAGEFHLHDEGFDSAALGWFVLLDRTNDTGAKEAFWGGYWVRGDGTKGADFGFRASLAMKCGLDLSGQTLDADKAAIAIPATGRIYFSSTSGTYKISALGTPYLSYDTDHFGFVGGSINPAAGTTTYPPIKYTAGTNLTTAAAGAVEYDGNALYATTSASNRGVYRIEHTVVLSSDYTLSNVATAQKAFNSTTNGALTLPANTTYGFEANYVLTNTGSSTHTWATMFGGTLAYVTANYRADAETAVGNTLSGVSAIYTTSMTSSLVTTTASSSTGENAMIKLRGYFRTSNASGTLIPQVVLSSATGGTQKVLANSFFTCWPIGSHTATTVGNWS